MFRLDFTDSSVTLFTKYNTIIAICQYPFSIKWWVFCCKEPTEPRAIMQLVHNPHMPHYRWHLTCLTNNGVIRQFSTHLFQPVDPISPPSKAHWRRLVPVCIPPTRHFNCTNSNKPMCLWWRRRVLPPRPVQSSIRIIKLYIIYTTLGLKSQVPYWHSSYRHKFFGKFNIFTYRNYAYFIEVHEIQDSRSSCFLI